MYHFFILKVISNEPPISFSIKVRQQASNVSEDVASGDNSEGEEDVDSDEEDEDSEDDSVEDSGHQQQGPCVELLFDLPSKYPDEKPSIQIIDSQNLEEQELADLLEDLSQKAEESLGTVMVFMLVSDVVEWLITKSEKEAEELEQEKEKRQKEVEADEKKRFDGTPVTVQTFLAWKAKFDAEMLKSRMEQQKQQQQAEASKGLTGREMFETDKTLAESDLNFVEDLDQNQIEALLHNIEEMDLQDEEGEDFELEYDEEDDDDEDDDDNSEDEYEDESDQDGEKEEADKKSSKVPHKSNSSKR